MPIIRVSANEHFSLALIRLALQDMDTTRIIFEIICCTLCHSNLAMVDLCWITIHSGLPALLGLLEIYSQNARHRFILDLQTQTYGIRDQQAKDHQGHVIRAAACPSTSRATRSEHGVASKKSLLH